MVRPRSPGDEPDGESHRGERDESDEVFIDLGGESGFLAAIPDDEVRGHEPAGRTRHAPGTADATPDDRADPRLPPIEVGAAIGRRSPSPPVEAPARRDRIVILGRRASGKTVFLARLYDHLFRGAEGLSAEALDGPSHLRCSQAMDELARGQWPAATGETSLIQLEIRFPGGSDRLVALDYPGEVFRRAFVDEVGGPDVMALLEHVDSAAAVMLLIDPGSSGAGNATESADNDFGMIQALRRIRSTPSGRSVPVAVVLTKVDANAHLLRAAGGLKPFVERTYPALVRAAAGARVFGCAAVRTMVDPLGRRLPQVRREAVGIVEPLAWCLASMGHLRRGERDEARRRQLAAALERERAEDAEAARRERRILIAVWSIVAVLLLVGALILAVVMSDGGAP